MSASFPGRAAAVFAGCALAAVCGATPASAQAAEVQREPQGVVALAASASVDVARDWLAVMLTVSRDGAEAAQVQNAVRQALDTALVEARKAARPGQVDVQTGNFSLQPRYTTPARGGLPTIGGWQGSAELLVEGRDTAAIAALVGRLTTMTVGRVAYSLSREQREKAETEMAAQAIARFRAKAAETARQFGYGSYAVREVTVSGGESMPQPPMPMMRMQAMQAAADAPLPVEAGRSNVGVTVSGTVQMK